MLSEERSNWIDLTPDTKVYHPDFSPEVLGKAGWGLIRSEGAIIGHSMPRDRTEFDATYLVQGVREALVEGKDWRQTRYFQDAARNINEGTVLWGCHDENALLHRLEHDVAGIFDSMRSQGFVEQSTIVDLLERGDEQFRQYGEAYHTPAGKGHEVKVAINEHGDVILIDGRHRLAIARVLSVPQVPVLVSARHARWAEFRDLLRVRARSESGGFSMRLSHPDLLFAELAVDDFEYAKGEADRLKIDLALTPAVAGGRLGEDAE